MYISDLTDEQWALIRPLFKGMRIYKWSKRLLSMQCFILMQQGVNGENYPKIFHHIRPSIVFIIALVKMVCGIKFSHL